MIKISVDAFKLVYYNAIVVMIKEEIPYEVEHQIVGIIYGRVCELISYYHYVSLTLPSKDEIAGRGPQ